jgi:hypothetical protein
LLKLITSWLPVRQEQQVPEPVQPERLQPERQQEPVQPERLQPERQQEPVRAQRPVRVPEPVRPGQQAVCHMRKQRERSKQQRGTNFSYENPLSIKYY